MIIKLTWLCFLASSIVEPLPIQAASEAEYFVKLGKRLERVMKGFRDLRAGRLSKKLRDKIELIAEEMGDADYDYNSKSVPMKPSGTPSGSEPVTEGVEGGLDDDYFANFVPVTENDLEALVDDEITMQPIPPMKPPMKPIGNLKSVTEMVTDGVDPFDYLDDLVAVTEKPIGNLEPVTEMVTDGVDPFDYLNNLVAVTEKFKDVLDKDYFDNMVAVTEKNYDYLNDLFDDELPTAPLMKP